MTTKALAAVSATDAVCPYAEVIGVHYDVATLVVIVRDAASEARWRIEFPGVEGFRVLDEGDLLEFWPACSGDALAWEITAGGWRQQECSRSGYVGRWTKVVREYFVKGANACVSVLAWSEPVVSPD